MVLVILLYIAVFFVFLFMGLYVLITNIRDHINVIFFCLSFLLAQSAVGGVVIQLTPDLATAQWLFKFNTSLTLLMTALFLVFAIEISNVIRRKLPVYLILGAVTLYLFLRFMRLPQLVDLISIDGLWYMREAYYPRLFLSYIAYVGAVMLTYLAVLLVWLKRTESVKEKRQAVILLVSYVLDTLVLLILLLFHYLGIIEHLLTGFGIFAYIIWFVGVFYSILKYHFLTFTPELASWELLENIDEFVIFLDREKKIVILNDRLESPNKGGMNDGPSLDDLFVEYQRLEKEIDDLCKGDYNSFVCKCSYRTAEGTEVPVSTRFSLVQDAYEDTLGIMIEVKQIKDIKQIKTFYRLTPREIEILQQLIIGLPYNEITRNMNITKNTLKRHIANIYIKLGVNNRVELINLLREYNMIPEEQADKTVLLVPDSSS